MKETRSPAGRTCWQPDDVQDQALLTMAHGSIFHDTTFPSGWKSPPEPHIALGGVLWELTDEEHAAVQARRDKR